MTLKPITEAFSIWMATVAGWLVALSDRRGPGRNVRLIEEEGGRFKVEIVRKRGSVTSPRERIRIVDGAVVGALPAPVKSALQGSRAELVLRPGRFLSRPLELPKRAGEFIEGIVRAQIDRLTPWTANEAAYGWTAPQQLGDRIQVTVIATARALVAPYLQALAALGAGSVQVSTVPDGTDPKAAPVRVLEHVERGALDMRRIQRLLTAVFLVTGLGAFAALLVAQYVTDSLDAEQQELTRRVSEQRALMRRDGSGGASLTQGALSVRKWETASTVVVVEALSQVLPDHTYVTELRVEGDKLQVIGITRDAPSLIRLLEQSPFFFQATFFAPTTRSPGDPGERFHIEARIKPVFT